MLEIVLLGLNHKTAPVELRECIAFSQEEADKALKTFQESPAIGEVVLISTCNRVEILLTTDNKPNAVDTVKMLLHGFKNIPTAEFEKALYIHDGDDAVRHIFRVASSLDSMVVGEPQILGQIKEAYKAATVNKTSGVLLNKLLHRTFFTAKRVRSETGIGDHAVSISYAAIELGRKIFGSLEGKKVLLVGAGEMAELAVEHLIRNKAKNIIVANRTFERGVKLAKRFDGKAVRFEEIPDCLQIVDIIIGSTGSPDLVVRRNQVKKVMRIRKNRPLFFIDIAVPRDIDPEINKLHNAYIYDIDDLKDIVDENIENRQQEAMKGERIVDEAVIRFRAWYDNMDVVPTIVALRNKVDNIAKSEINKTLRSLEHLSDDDLQAIRKMANAMTKKILHDPTLLLKSNGFHRSKSIYIDLTRKLFKLDNNTEE
ncbi:MAG: glutamyl-tRNA reductase [Desulfobacterales bacterium]|nr:MAG: glutamyl-tRNA reductase [Desulfobacterales bacterium]